MQTKHKSAINEANHQDDTTLFQEFLKGDMDAFSHFYDTYVNVLYHFGSKITSDKELLKDCIHDVFIKYTINVKIYPISKISNLICLVH